jgi:hypothetical protein
MQANYARSEHEQRDDDLGRGSVGELGGRYCLYRTILSISHNIAPRLLYIESLATDTHKNHCSEALARSFFGGLLKRAGKRELLNRGIACLAVAFEGFEQFGAAELRNRRAANREKLNGLNARNRLGGD